MFALANIFVFDGAAAAAPPLCGAGLYSSDRERAIGCYLGSFLDVVIAKVNRGDSRTAEHQREALLFYLGGPAVLDMLLKDSMETNTCKVCTTNPLFRGILNDVRG